MVEQSFRGVLILLVSSLLVAPVLPLKAQSDQQKDEVVIEGRDKQPARSSFEYDTVEGDTPDYSNIGTKDAPHPAAPTAFDEPELDRDTGTLEHGKLKRSKVTAVDEFSTTELMIIGVGVMAVLAVI